MLPNKTVSEKPIKSKKNVSVVQCGPKYFEYSNHTEVHMYGIDDLMCFEFENYSLQGDFYSQSFNYL